MIEELEQLNEELEKTNEKLNQEIERLNDKVEELMELYTTERHCKDDYKAIVKEVKEYIEEMQIWLVDFEDFGITTKGLLEILDKEEV